MNHRSEPGSQRATLWLVLLTLAAAAVRLPLLGHESFWKDELSIWTFVNVPTLGQAIHKGAVVDPHPPLYMLIVFPVVHLLGMSETIFRLPSALLGIAAVPAIYALARRCFSWKEGLICAAFMALLFRPIYYSLEARNYMLLGFSSICLGIAWVFVMRAMVDRRSAPWPKLLACAFLVDLAPFSHYFGALLGLVMIVHLGARSVTLRSGRKNVLTLIGFSALLYAPWVPFALKTFGRSNDSFWIDKPHLNAPLVYVTFFYGRFPIVIALMTALAVAYFVLSYRRPEPEGKVAGDARFDREVAILLAVWLLAPFLIVLLKSLTSTSFFLNRYFFICLPAAYLATARGITMVAGSQRSWAVPVMTTAIIGLAWIGILAIDHSFSRPEKSQYREAVEFIRGASRSSGASPTPVLSTQPMLSYYVDRPGSGLALVAADHKDSPLPSTGDYLSRHHPDEFWYLDAQDDVKLTGPEQFRPVGYKALRTQKFKDVIAILFARS